MNVINHKVIKQILKDYGLNYSDEEYNYFIYCNKIFLSNYNNLFIYNCRALIGKFKKCQSDYKNNNTIKEYIYG